jgi:hypothetical protein
MRRIIESWFILLETNEEYVLSRSIFNSILNTTKMDLGEHAVISIEDLVRVLDLKKKYLYHYNFVGKTTLGFKGDSIVESSFSSTKRDKKAVSTRKTIDRSAMNMVNQTLQTSSKRNSDFSSNLEREVCWSRATARNILTKYALGLYCKNFDRRNEYFTVRIGEREWLSMFENHFGPRTEKMEIPNFIRVRLIRMDEHGFLNCSCGKTGEYLLPCQHICSVVKEDKYFTPDMFHVRWHKHFCYVHGNSFGKGILPEEIEVIRDLFQDIRTNHYDSNGLYKGVPMKKNGFLSSLPPFTGKDEKDKKLKFMEYVLKTSILTPVQSHITSFGNYLLESSNESVDNGEVIGDFSLMSQEEFQDCNVFPSHKRKRIHKDDEKSGYHQTIEGYEKALDMISKPSDIDEINQFFMTFVNLRIAERKTHTQSVGGTVLFGENIKKGSKVEKRHPFFYETLP